MAIVNFDDKVALNENPNVADINKVKDTDMNMLKDVENQVITSLGLYTDTWTSSATFNIGDITIYDNRLFENLTGTNTATTPDQDITNWEEISLFVS